MTEEEKKAFGLFEATLDDEIKKLELSKYPLRTILTLFHMGIYDCCTQEKDYESKCNCSTFSSIYSYLLIHLNMCDKKTIGGDAYDIFTVLPDSFQDELLKVINYGSFCEIAPFVWKDVYEPNVINDNELDLYYKDNSYMVEVKDALLTSLTSSFSINDEKSNYLKYDEQVVSCTLKGKFDFTLMYEEIKRGQAWYQEHWYDDKTVSESIYIELGLTKDIYKKFQIFWFSFCDYYIKSANAINRYMKKNNDESRLIQNEFLEHFSPFLKKIFFYKYLTEAIIGIKEEQFNKLMGCFSQNVKNEFLNLDGYFPAFFEFDDSYLFSCYNTKMALSSRNLLYLINRRDEKLFNNYLSEYLEPNLIEHAIDIFKRFPDIEIKKNIKWRKSEFDLLIYFKKENIILHIQAKGSIPVEGARMTRNLDTRMEEGINQLNKFKDINKQDKESELSKIFNEEIKDIEIIDVLLGWGGFGTKKTWDLIDNNGIVALNLSLLNEYVKRFNEKILIKNLKKDTDILINEIIDNSLAKKKYIQYNIADKIIHYESFGFSSSKLLKYKYI